MKKEIIFCPSCGEEMNSWQGDIYECENCGNMIDVEVFEDEEEAE